MIIERDPTHRWEFRFYVDGHTQRCGDTAHAPPPWLRSNDHKIEIDQADSQGYSDTSYALRGGVPVVIADESCESVREGDPVVAHDFDKLVKRKEGAYPAVQGLKPLP